MGFRIATWNINSIRLRENSVCRFLSEHAPDVLCLQELKSPTELIPRKKFYDLGYKYICARGQKSYNGVALLSRVPIVEEGYYDFCSKGDARHIFTIIEGGVEIHNFYVPAGGDVANREKNSKFAHKLDFLMEMRDFFENKNNKKIILVGDLNIAPRPDDVWSHKQLLNVVSHTQIEVDSLNEVFKAGNFVDVTRRHLPTGPLFSWWSYRSPNWALSNRGRRLDHIWSSPDLAELSKSSFIFRDARNWEKPSDHVPVISDFDL